MSKHSKWNFLKEILSSKPVLKFFHPTQRVTLQVDASKLGQGAGILQDEYPIVYASRFLTPAEENYSQIKKELIIVVFGCERFNHYVYGRPVELDSDHETLAPITKKPLVNSPAMLQRLRLRLQKYDISITYVAGKYMHVADTLFRASLDGKSANTELNDDMEVWSTALLQISP